MPNDSTNSPLREDGATALQCEFCHNTHLHRVGCPSLELLPKFNQSTYRPDPPSCPDCHSRVPGLHREGCIVRKFCQRCGQFDFGCDTLGCWMPPLPDATEVEALRRMG